MSACPGSCCGGGWRWRWPAPTAQHRLLYRLLRLSACRAASLGGAIRSGGPRCGADIQPGRLPVPMPVAVPPAAPPLHGCRLPSSLMQAATACSTACTAPQMALWSFYEGDYGGAVEAATAAHKVWVRGVRASWPWWRGGCFGRGQIARVLTAGHRVLLAALAHAVGACACAAVCSSAGKGDGRGQPGGGLPRHPPGHGAGRCGAAVIDCSPAAASPQQHGPAAAQAAASPTQHAPAAALSRHPAWPLPAARSVGAPRGGVPPAGEGPVGGCRQL